MPLDSFSDLETESPLMPAHRPAVTGTRHLVVAGHYLAAHAGFEILEAGGNAVDAGVAAGIALGVLQSDMVNVAGVAPIILYLAESQKVVTISGLGTWPKAVSLNGFRKQYGGSIPQGLPRTVVPSAPDAWITALEHFGTMGFDEVVGAAIRFARDGFPLHPFTAGMIEASAESYRRWPSSAEIYLPGGQPPRPHRLFHQTDLGRTLQYMADEASHAGGRAAGLQAVRDAFYRGDIASTIIQFHRENGGLLTMEDLNEFRVEIEEPLRTSFGDIDVFTCGPWCQGPVLLQALNLVAGYDLRGYGHNSTQYLHTLVEALKLAFADRHYYYGDPRFVDVPMKALLSEAYTQKRRTLIRDQEAWPKMPPAGDPRALAAVAPSQHLEPTVEADGSAGAGLDTSYVCVVDQQGNVFSATPSDNSSDTPVIPGTGLCPSSRGSQSWTDPRHPSCIAPGKRPRLTPNPALALRNGKPFLAIGSPGGDVQAQAMLQTFLNIVLFDMDPQQAVEAPRVVTYSFPDSFEPHCYFPGRLNVESRIERDVGAGLSAFGHEVHWWPDWIWRSGAVCCITIDQQTGVLQGGADPRRPSYAVGW